MLVGGFLFVLPTGALLRGRYQIERIVGQGGMGAVYRARDAVLDGKIVAVKEMRIAGVLEREKAVALFRREASLLARLEHPGLVDVTDFFEEGEAAYLVMSFVDGLTLTQCVTRETPSVPRVLGWMDEVCDVLAYLHEQDPPIIFRDLKPSNIMIDARGRVRLIDFGIARTLDVGGRTATALRGFLTPGFAPIEQYSEAGSTDPRSDIYSLGATMYNLLTGFVPPEPVQILTGEARLVPLTSIRPEAGLPLESVLTRMLDFHKVHRYATVQEARHALAQAAPSARSTPGGVAPAPAGPTLVPSSSTTAPSRASVPSRFCSNCGSPREALARWCTTCGEAIDDDEIPAATLHQPSRDDGNLTLPSRKPTGAVESVAATLPLHASTARPATVPGKAAASPPAFSRRLRFPTTGALGTVWVRDDDRQEWEEVGEARATLTIPPGKQVRLRVASHPDRLMAIDDLEPDDLHSVDLSETVIKDDDFQALAHAYGLAELLASDNPVGDAALARIRGLGQLRVLAMNNTRVTDEGARMLQGFRTLRVLHLGHTPLQDAGVANLRTLPDLEDLDLSFTRITDAAMSPVAELSRLKRLAVAGTRVGDRGMVPLTELAALQWLDVARTRVTDSGLTHLQDLPLVGLILADTHVGDLGLASVLCDHPFEELDLGGTPLQPATVRLLQHQHRLRRLTLRALPVSGHLEALPAGAPLEHLDLSSCRLTRQDVVCVARQQALRSLDLRGTPLDDDDLEPLRQLEGLQVLHLDDTRVSGRGLAFLPVLRQLNTLTLGGCPLESLPLPQPLLSLENLVLRKTTITDRTLADLRILPSLRCLDVSDTTLTDAGLEHLKPLRFLDTLDLAGTRVRGHGLEHLRALPRLRSLDLGRTMFQDESIRRLRGFDGLRRLNLSHTQITGHGLATLPVLALLEDLDLSFNNLGPGDYRVLPDLPALRWMNLAEM